MSRDKGPFRRPPVIYQIYPRSFRDTTGSGEGDLRGITEGLPHVASLGVDAIWLSPFYPSPMEDGGYDIADHRGIDPRYGIDADFDALVARAHDLGLKVLVDLVLNHTSRQHPWFQAALAGDPEMAARYVFAEAKPDGTAPNNWLSFFGPPAWTWAHQRRQYYLHQFLACQPNLNLRNDAVLADHAATVAYWRDRGVDGFRLDAVTSYLPNKDLVDNDPADPAGKPFSESSPDNPRSRQHHDRDMMTEDCAVFMDTIRSWAGDAMWLMGENGRDDKSLELARAFTGPGRLDASYTTDLVQRLGDAAALAEYLNHVSVDRAIPSWMSCHDQPRVASRGDGSPGAARFYLLLLALLPGPLLMFQGEELGLPQPVLHRNEVTDPFDLLYWPDGPGREGPRVPYPWRPGLPQWGFTSGTPWLPMRWDPQHCLASQELRTDSPLAFTRQVLAFRSAHGLSDPRRLAARAEGDVLHLELDAGDIALRATFNLGSARVSCPAEPPLIASGPTGDGLAALTGAVWRR